MTSDDKTSHWDEHPIAKTSSSSLYKTIWRWHFYAGLIFTPFLLILAITGGIYLFKPQIENFLYQDLYEVENEQGSIPPSKQIEAVTSKYVDAHVYKYRPSDSPTRSSEVGVHIEDGTYTIFVNPHNGEVIGQLNDKDRLMDNIEKFHGELMVGTIGDRIVELAACWGIVLVVTGIYLWWPRRKTKFWGVVLPRFFEGEESSYERFTCSTCLLDFSRLTVSYFYRSSVVWLVGEYVSADYNKCRTWISAFCLGW